MPILFPRLTQPFTAKGQPTFTDSLTTAAGKTTHNLWLYVNISCSGLRACRADTPA
jgi:hypothetical protein